MLITGQIEDNSQELLRKREYNRIYYQTNLIKVRAQHAKYQKSHSRQLLDWAIQYRRTPEGHFKHLQKIAKRRNIEVMFDKNWFVSWLSHQSFKCNYCGCLLKYGHRFDAPSVDRMINNREYAKDNIILSCRLCNSVKNNFFSVNEMKEIGNLIQKFKKERNTIKVNKEIHC